LLGINGSARDTTPYLASVSDQYLNYGITCAASNISSSTNAIMRSGLRLDQLPDTMQRSLKQPSIFQYAKAAGYRTCFLDAQYSVGMKSNFMTDRDLDDLDVVYWATTDEPDPTKRYRRDQLLAQRIIELLADGEPTFIWLNKYGAHFHYEQTYPEEARVFTPNMRAGEPIDTSTMEEVQNSYANALRWSVDSFFETIAPSFDDDTVVLYTSDHGQSFNEGPRISTHANRVAPPVSQARVPLLGWGSLLKQRFPEGAASVRDRVSHYEIFPTMLILMGYGESEVVSRYARCGTPPPAVGCFCRATSLDAAACASTRSTTSPIRSFRSFHREKPDDVADSRNGPGTVGVPPGRRREGRRAHRGGGHVAHLLVGGHEPGERAHHGIQNRIRRLLQPPGSGGLGAGGRRWRLPCLAGTRGRGHSPRPHGNLQRADNQRRQRPG
jgi:hypothetical protein